LLFLKKHGILFIGKLEGVIMESKDRIRQTTFGVHDLLKRELCRTGRENLAATVRPPAPSTNPNLNPAASSVKPRKNSPH